MQNSYYLMRHGKSEANKRGIIVSDPLIGTVRYGLSREGRMMIPEAVKTSPLDKATVIYTSDFLRARETAQAVALLLKADAPILTESLRERFFGTLDGGGDDQYHKVWEHDRKDNHNTWAQVESPQAVRDRTEGLINELEGRYTGKKILLVSHGDALQILQTFFENKEPREHRELNHLNTGEIREMTKRGE